MEKSCPRKSRSRSEFSHNTLPGYKENPHQDEAEGLCEAESVRAEAETKAAFAGRRLPGRMTNEQVRHNSFRYCCLRVGPACRARPVRLGKPDLLAVLAVTGSFSILSLSPAFLESSAWPPVRRDLLAPLAVPAVRRN